MRSLVRTSPRRLRLASVTVLIGVAALGGVAAWNPATTAGSADAVSFTGGCGLLGTGLGGSSSPDTSHLSVPAGSGVEFTNRLDHPAELRLNGEPVAKVPAGGTEEVTFFEGPVTAEMHLDCALGKPSGAVTVEVLQDVAAAPRTATGNRAPGNRVPAGAVTVPPDGSDGSDRGDGERPGSGSEPGRSPSPASAQPGISSGRGTQSPGAPSGQPAPSSPDQSDSRGDLAPTRPAAPGQPGGPAPDGAPGAGAPGSGAPGSGEAGPEASGGWWPGSPSGSDAGPAGAEGGPESDAGSDPGSGSGRPDTDKAPQTGPAATDQAPNPDHVGADEITHAADAAPPGGSIGLLALIATVCVVGVSAGAVRAILTQRSNGAGLA